MTKIDTLKSYLEEESKLPKPSITNVGDVYSYETKMEVTYGAGKWLPLDFLEQLIREIEELEERCGEKEPSCPVVPLKLPNFLNFQSDEFEKRFV